MDFTPRNILAFSYHLQKDVKYLLHTVRKALSKYVRASLYFSLIHNNCVTCTFLLIYESLCEQCLDIIMITLVELSNTVKCFFWLRALAASPRNDFRVCLFVCLSVRLCERLNILAYFTMFLIRVNSRHFMSFCIIGTILHLKILGSLFAEYMELLNHMNNWLRAPAASPRNDFRVCLSVCLVFFFAYFTMVFDRELRAGP